MRRIRLARDSRRAEGPGLLHGDSHHGHLQRYYHLQPVFRQADLKAGHLHRHRGQRVPHGGGPARLLALQPALDAGGVRCSLQSGRRGHRCRSQQLRHHPLHLASHELAPLLKSDLFQEIQVCADRDVVNTQEIVGGGHHIDMVRLTLARFFSINWYTDSSGGDFWRITPITRKSVLRKLQSRAWRYLGFGYPRSRIGMEEHRYQ